MSRQSLAIALLSMGFVAAVTLAEVPNKSPDQLEESATHIVTGKVKHVYTSESEQEQSIKIAGVVEVLVSEVEKGDGLKSGHVLYGRFWRSPLKPGVPPTPRSAGHRGLPKEGETVRVYVRQDDDGGYNILFPNGVSPATHS